MAHDHRFSMAIGIGSRRELKWDVLVIQVFEDQSCTLTHALEGSPLNSLNYQFGLGGNTSVAGALTELSRCFHEK